MTTLPQLLAPLLRAGAVACVVCCGVGVVSGRAVLLVVGAAVLVATPVLRVLVTLANKPSLSPIHLWPGSGPPLAWPPGQV